MIVISFFKWIAPFYDPLMKISGHGRSLQELVNQIEPSPGEKLLDLGGGTGQLLQFLPAEINVTLVDSSRKMLARARKKNFSQDVKFVRAEAEKLPFPDEEFDYAVIADSLHHFEGIEDAVREIKRVLKPSGELYILEFDPASILTGVISAGEKILGEPANFYRAEELVYLIKKIGFQAEIEQLSTSIYIVRARCVKKK